MTILALALIFTSSFLHATWNLMAKNARGGLPFIWLFMTITAVVFTPVALLFIFIERPGLSPMQIVFAAGSGLLHLIYFVLLNRGYRTGDLSLVYPLARGTGPMLATIGAVLLFDERPSAQAVAGIVSIGVGVFVFTDGARKLRDPQARAATGYALLTGTSIAAYTLWDTHAVSVLLTAPLIHTWLSDVFQLPFLTIMMQGKWDEARFEWRTHRREAFAVAILSPLAYLLVLAALVVTPVSYVAPLREVSILIGAAMGTLLLSEGETRRRWSASAIIVAGVIALALG